MVSGKVIRFDEVRGYGFVVPDHGGEDVFVHVNDLEFDKGLMAPGVKVEFVVDEGDRGPKASNVRFLEGAPGRSGGVHRSQSGLSDGPFEDGVLCDTLSAQEFLDEVTELLVTGVPSMTGEQILQARQRLLKQAQSHEWVDA
ncbi:cold-shock protein [Streptomyces rimosus]|uniref:cold-shock protein n=1 Tax=Streptomyces rimosus TaxID=1927 RepID=UPI0004CABA61|nr:cold shock domain-containing protein [Streptomyces rimosus]